MSILSKGGKHRHHIINRLINCTYCLPCFALLVTAKIHFEEEALVAGTKQSTSGWQGCKACLLCFVPIAKTCTSKWLCTNTSLAIYFFLDVYGGNRTPIKICGLPMLLTFRVDDYWMLSADWITYMNGVRATCSHRVL